jgi:hypothetical protein
MKSAEDCLREIYGVEPGDDLQMFVTLCPKIEIITKAMKLYAEQAVDRCYEETNLCHPDDVGDLILNVKNELK